jgi:uncharacterized Rmd1/YagE family protein
MGLIAFYLPQSYTRNEIEARLDLNFKKGIEATWYSVDEESVITYTQFNVLCLINYSRHQVSEMLDTLGIPGADEFEDVTIHQDYPLVFDKTLSSDFDIDNDSITLRTFSLMQLLIAAHVVSQSVALDQYEQKLSDYYERSRDLIDTADTYSIFKRAKLAKFAKQLVLMRHDMVIDLYLLDKPDIVWENENAEALYNRLAEILELKERFDVVEYKLSSIKDDIVMVMDLTNHNHSSFLEWIIIILIGVEIVMGLVEWFAPGFGH